MTEYKLAQNQFEQDPHKDEQDFCVGFANEGLMQTKCFTARNQQENRFDKTKIHCNAQMSTSILKEHCAINKEAMTLLKLAMEKLDLSARAYDRILKVSRTIADLENCRDIQTVHVAEAIQYRSLDREAWAG